MLYDVLQVCLTADQIKKCKGSLPPLNILVEIGNGANGSPSKADVKNHKMLLIKIYNRFVGKVPYIHLSHRV